ncbi:hypothetical protein CDIK_3985, partial [Cucumispora dikerogammari]
REVSVRKDSVFFNIKIPLKIIFLIIYEWSLNSQIKDIKRRSGVGYKAINSVLIEIRKKTMNLKFEKIGRPKCIIEIDETAVTKRKFKWGRRVFTLWCVWGVCRVHKSFFFELTKKRNKKTLRTILDRHINTQSHIITDEWRNYWGLNQGFESHKTICHKKYFVDPKDPSIHTQNIECM